MVVTRPEGKAEQLLAESGMPIGVMEGVPFANFEAPIQAGECYAFYSDGISEARNRKKDEFSIEALERVMLQHQKQDAAEILKASVDAVTQFMGKADQHDDMTLIVVKVT